MSFNLSLLFYFELLGFLLNNLGNLVCLIMKRLFNKVTIKLNLAKGAVIVSKMTPVVIYIPPTELKKSIKFIAFLCITVVIGFADI